MRTSKMLLTVWILAAAASVSWGGGPDLKNIYDHIHKTFNTPTSFTILIKDLKPSRIKGMLRGTLLISDGKHKQEQTIHITRDGRRYILSDAYRLKKGIVPGMRSPVAGVGQSEPPAMSVTEDGGFVLYGPSYDASVDPEKENLSKMKLDGVPAKGPKDAPILFVEYSDVECPYCARAHTVFKKTIAEGYQGKVRTVFKHFPLKRIHPWAYDAAIAVSCAGMQKSGYFYELVDGFFAARGSINTENLRDKVAAMAEKAGADKRSFLDCFDKKGSKNLVEADIREGETLGVTGTPSIYINGRRVHFRAYSSAEITPIFDEMLQKSKKKKG